MTTDKSSVRILIYNDCGTEKFLNVFFPVIFVSTCIISPQMRWQQSTHVLSSASFMNIDTCGLLTHLNLPTFLISYFTFCITLSLFIPFMRNDSESLLDHGLNYYKKMLVHILRLTQSLTVNIKVPISCNICNNNTYLNFSVQIITDHIKQMYAN